MSMNALRIGSSGLRLAQLGVDTASHNVSNAATDGYSRQRVEQSSAYPRQLPEGIWVGSGVQLDGITRARESFLDARVRYISGQAGEYAVRHEAMMRVEDGLGEPDNGVTAAMSRLFASFNDLVTRPSDDPTRQQVLSALSDVAQKMNSMRDTTDSITADAQTRLSREVIDANALADKVAALNGQGATLPADLADERDRLADQLAYKVGGRVIIDSQGFTRVTVDGYAIVDADRSMRLSVDMLNPGVLNHPAGQVNASGIIGGIQKTITQDIPAARTAIDTLIADVLTQLNTQHAANLTPAGTPGGLLLDDVAGYIVVVPTVPADIAAADAAGGALNGAGADALYQLRLPLMDAASTAIDQMTNSTASLGRAEINAAITLESAKVARSSVTGVNVDEEMVDMVTYQKAYAAAAKVITTADEMLSALINMI